MVEYNFPLKREFKPNPPSRWSWWIENFYKTNMTFGTRT
jgi:hypothetical protein